MFSEEKDILIVEPFNGGSHGQLIKLLQSDNEIGPRCCLVSLPAKKWHWRARTSALYFSQTIPFSTRSYRVLFTSSVLNLAELVALRPDLSPAKKIVYFHENQLVYPVRKMKDRDFQYGYNQILTSLVADVVVFNSAFNMNSFLSSISSHLKLIPDHRPKNIEALIHPKFRVLPFPVNIQNISKNNHPFCNAISCSNLDHHHEAKCGTTEQIASLSFNELLNTHSELENDRSHEKTHSDLLNDKSNENINSEVPHDKSNENINSEVSHDKSSENINSEVSHDKSNDKINSEVSYDKSNEKVHKKLVNNKSNENADNELINNKSNENTQKELLNCRSKENTISELLNEKGNESTHSEQVSNENSINIDTTKLSTSSDTSFINMDTSSRDFPSHDIDSTQKCDVVCRKKFITERSAASVQDLKELHSASAALNLMPSGRDGTCLHIVWPHRWEHDKDPESFFRALLQLQGECLKFRVSVIGETFTDVPEVFSLMKPQLADRIVAWGYQNRADYLRILSTAHVVVSTALHEFFGVSMLEATGHGCYPLCPRRLVYPEIYPEECLYSTQTQLIKRLRKFCQRPDLIKTENVRLLVDKFSWHNLQAEYRKLLLE